MCHGKPQNLNSKRSFTLHYFSELYKFVKISVKWYK